MAFIIFVLIFLGVVNRSQIKSIFEGFVKERSKSEDLRDFQLLNFIKEKAGLKIRKIKLLDTKATWGMMAGLPWMPYMILSRDAYENFSKDEMQWLLLHEAGHYKFWHSSKMFFLQLACIFLGFFLLLQTNNEIPSLLLALSLAILFAILYVQITRNFEYEANYFALSKMDNPKCLKNMYQKAKERWRKKGKPEDTLWQKLFNVWILEIYKDLAKKPSSLNYGYLRNEKV
jgi:Zn-dependent protease with chaperone function